jgi:coenzyme F420-0:L-glutamate ligase/coenzyme F420-1:gamma-L-glutamate ligase
MPAAQTGFSVFAVPGIPEIEAGMDLGLVIGDAVAPLGLHHGDILVVSSKIVSKAEGRIVHAEDREQAITAETVRVVATREFPGGVTRIVENHLGIVGAAAGVDASNTPHGTVLLLPLDPDASASRIRSTLQDRFEVELGIVISDTSAAPGARGRQMWPSAGAVWFSSTTFGARQTPRVGCWMSPPRLSGMSWRRRPTW